MERNWLRRAALGTRSRLNDHLGRQATRRLDPALSALVAELNVRGSDAPIRSLTELQDAPGRVATAWRGLGGAGYELVRHFRPRHIVELGSFGGFSACVFGLALRDHVPGGRLTAVDTWTGDAHTGNLDQSVFDQFQQFRNQLGLEGIIEPLRMRFSDAAVKLSGPVNMLHIDGWHTYRAVTRDFALFRPLLAPHAVVLFHDVNAHFTGMRWFWRSIVRQYPAAMIPQSFGLGVLQIA